MVTIDSSSPTVACLHPSIGQAVSQLARQRFAAPDRIVMHLRSGVDQQGARHR